MATLPQDQARARRRSARPTKALWKGVRVRLARSRLAKHILASAIAAYLRLVARTNRRVAGSSEIGSAVADFSPAIAAFWHGQHLLAPTLRPGGLKMLALFSRSADAEINALVASKLGFDVVRGSGGRKDRGSARKGGARALISLKTALAGGTNVAMIADIPHGTPRQAGMGIVTLAKVSGRPIVPIALATSRRKIIEKSWDKTTINLPFGRSALVIGDPIVVAADSDAEAMEAGRQALTNALNAATQKAYDLVDGRR